MLVCRAFGFACQNLAEWARAGAVVLPLGAATAIQHQVPASLCGRRGVYNPNEDKKRESRPRGLGSSSVWSLEFHMPGVLCRHHIAPWNSCNTKSLEHFGSHVMPADCMRDAQLRSLQLSNWLWHVARPEIPVFLHLGFRFPIENGMRYTPPN